MMGPTFEPNEVSLHSTMDAGIWAKEFNKVYVKLNNGLVPPLDEGWLISWYANAIMTGYDFGVIYGRRQKTEVDEIERIHKVPLYIVRNIICSAITAVIMFFVMRW